MGIKIVPGHKVGRDGGSFQEVELSPTTQQILKTFDRFCTIRDDEQAPPTSKPSRHWHQIFRTPDSTE